MSRLNCRIAHPRRERRFILSVSELDARIVPAVTATFTPGTGNLSVVGDANNNTITIGRNAAGTILVNGGAIHVTGGVATVANTALIAVSGGNGNDTIKLDETNGALPAANLSGENGNDVLSGGSGEDLLSGGAGNDNLLGKGGGDSLFGGDGNDVLTGGTGDDQVFGENGDDRMIWNPGDGTDLNEGGDGTDTTEVNGDVGAEVFAVTANGSRVRFDRVTPAPFSLDIGSTEKLVVKMNGGDDSFTAGNGLASLIQISVDGGAGNDSITGGDGADSLFGGDGNDLIVGGRGNDTTFMGAGDDTFVWNPGDGSDVVEGQTGSDTLLFNGANVGENINIFAHGHRVRFTRDVGNINMDLNDLETITFTALGGSDAITVNNLAGTSVTRVNLHLGASGGTGDGAADTVTVDGTNAADRISVTGSGSAYEVDGLHAVVAVDGSEGANDGLVIYALKGSDVVDAETLPAGVVSLSVDGGSGNDSITGSAGADLLIGGDGNDLVQGERGDDTALLGAGNDVFEWDPGDGSDIVEGQDGIDKLEFEGANVNENIDIEANGSRVRFFRDVGNVTMDLNDVEAISFDALGGADTITIGDMSRTGVKKINLNLAGSNGKGDGNADRVIINGTAGDDSIHVANGVGSVGVTGLAAAVHITGAEPANDQLFVDGLAGNDSINASALAANFIQLTENGGDGDDSLVGSRGADSLLGGAGDDVLHGGPGTDLLDGGSGINTVVQ